MKKSLLKNNLKTIIKTRRRFLSILAMAFLGVGFFSGLIATSLDIHDSLDKYLDNSNFYDINIVSTLGLTDDDIKSLQKIEGVENVYGIQTKDSFALLDEKESIVKVIEYNENINIPIITAGRMPENSNECLLDSGYTIDGKADKYIGKTITLKNEDLNEDGNAVFTTKELTIVGITESPLYISGERGTTTIGNGTVSFYIYCIDNFINLDYYTEIGIIVENAKEELTNQNEYLNLINSVSEKIEEIKEKREQARYDEIVNELLQEINDAQKELDEKKEEIYGQLEDAKNQIILFEDEIDLKEKNLNNLEIELNNQEKKLNEQFRNIENQILEAEKNYAEKVKEIEIELENKKNQLNEDISKIDFSILEYQEVLTELKKQKEQLIKNISDIEKTDALILQTQNEIEKLNNEKEILNQQLKDLEEKNVISQNELKLIKSQIETQKQELENNKNIAYEKLFNSKLEVENGKKQIQQAKTEIKKSELEFEQNKLKANQEINDAQEEIDLAKKDIDKIEMAKWYVQDRLNNTGYVNIFDAIQTVSNVSQIFPVIFYLVAVLISLTSMTRMIDEERTEIGTLKALGYTNNQIILKYILYAFLACVIGGILGMSVGFYLIPTIVWNLYSIMYTIPEFIITYRLKIGLSGILIAFICIGGATILSAYKELRENPSTLMRPKAPKIGKRILLERIGHVWKKLNFSQKITLRNIFRYKKRAIITITGIAGCTGLMLAGFGIRDSVIDIPDFQFQNIFKYETSVMLSNTNGLDNIRKYLNQNKNIENFNEVYATTIRMANEKLDYNINVLVPNDLNKFEEVTNLVDNKENKLQIDNDGVIITDKLADKFNINVGDEIDVIDSDDLVYKLKVVGITKNYIYHYIYMSKEYYEKVMNDEYQTNMLLINVKNISEEQNNIISEELLNIEGVASISIISSLIKSVSDMLNTINYVVIVLIVTSAILEFVVLYNLANINIGERKREIATLKVLGFYDKEVDNYINKENIIFTIIGVILGLGFGVLLTFSIIESIEIDSLKFAKHISLLSYLISAFTTIVFSLIVNFIIHFVLKKIDMIESLKSVE